MSEYIYNDNQNIRTSARVEKIYSTNRGFIGRLESVDYKQSDGSWKEQGSRWLINEDDAKVIMSNGFKSTKL
ncbi:MULTISPECIES: hypothetical protein [Vibrio]|uniref:Uncharacterized protein n=4 Tax=Vibrio TaxID=662 RepID=A7DVC2_VIBVL|nr:MULTISPECIES: hypothetical protein [Vibrio]ASJ41572.1 hypothetical protein VVCECT4999_23120 [Vibrio vulnificus]AZS26353.1 hypothetical protein DYL72_15725 [Vibrio anguillarum]EGQ7984277.1 hypothetical protein [Vibrio vulnificus]EGR0354251.1 hypothetical protein [Vibrio vulnificus]EGR0637490.1 hypothetical protein [Vibrio vulnificus]